MRGLGVTFSTSLRICEKCDFEQRSYGFDIFFDFRKVDFRPQKIYFSDVVSKKVKPKVNGNDGLNSLKIFAAITKSAKTGKKIKI